MSQDNILLITTDQQRFDTIQALGNSSIYTPRLNHLYTQGTAYTRCYADCPICVPSRTTLMTGLRGYESGVVTNAPHAQVMGQATARRATLPALLTDAGYQTRAMGKMHFDPMRACYGFESMTLPIDCLRSCEKQGLRPKTHGAMEQHDLAALPAYQEKRRELFQKLLEHTSKTRPQALENGYFRTSSAPSRPGDVGFRWLGFHYHDFNYDVFH